MKILFIGNSHTYYNDMPDIVTNLYILAGKEKPLVTMLCDGGKTYIWHSDKPQTRFNIKYGRYDKVVMQDRAHPFIGTEQFFEGIELMKALIDPTGAKICLSETWPSLAHDYPRLEEILPAHHAASKKYRLALAPCGDAWAVVRATHPEIEIYFTDGEHPSGYGSYLNACLIYRAINEGEQLRFVESEIYNKRGLDVDKCRILMDIANATPLE